MRKILLMAALCMAAVLVFAPMTVAQSASPAGGSGFEGNPCGGFELGSPEADECYADLGVEPPSGDMGDASSIPPSESASPSADPCPDPEFPRETPDGCQASDLPDVTDGGTPVATADATAEAEDDSSATATATAESSASALPETGGPNPAASALPSLALLVAGGIFAARLFRR